MKNIIKLSLILTSILLGCAITFYFWAKHPCLHPSKYVQIEKYNNKKPPVDSTLKILTYNIGYLSGMTNNLAIRGEESLYQQNLDNILVRLKEIDADIAAFQEIDFDSQRSYHVDQNKKIGAKLFAYSAIAVNWDKRYVPFPHWPIRVQFGKILSGQSVASKYEIEQNESITLQKVKNNPFYYNAFYLDRLAQIVKIKHPIKDVTIINIHVEAFDKTTRIAQLKSVLKLAREKAKEGAVIVLGNFNSDAEYKDAACKIFFADDVFNCTDTNVKNVYKKSFPSNRPVERLDYIFYTRRDFIVQKSYILNNFGSISDHLPVFSCLKFI